MILGVALAGISSARATTVFFDDFSEPANTPIFGKPADIGSSWYGFGTPPSVDAGGAFDTTGAARNAFADFTDALGPGQSISLSFDSLPMASGPLFASGVAGISLYFGPTEGVFVGDTFYGNTWGVDESAVGGPHLTDSPVRTASVLFTYVYDTGEWSLTVNNGSTFTLSGVGQAQEPFDNLRVANDMGGDFRVDNIKVDISPVPEVSSLVFLIAGLPVLARRCR